MCKKKMNVVQKEGVSDNSLQAFCDASNLIELEASTHRNGRQGAYLWCCVRTTQGAPAPRAHALLPHDPGRERRRLCAGSCAHVQRLGAGAGLARLRRPPCTRDLDLRRMHSLEALLSLVQLASPVMHPGDNMHPAIF